MALFLEFENSGYDMRPGHLPGHCPYGYHADECLGIEYYMPDPYDEEILGETNLSWFCAGSWQNTADEI